ncbi:MAG: hypothetical protein GX112_10050 [Clostridiaceae bacterium]|jgi:hypothetical protein|nr:hypothetical protein [Clostridiaceae bacterium]
MIDKIFTIAFASAYTAIFEIGSVMALLMLLFGILDYKKGDALRRLIERRRLDRPFLMTVLALIPVDGTLLFQYGIYRRKSIRSGSLLGGIIGIGEEATYIILSIQPLAWLALAGIKLLLAVGLGNLLNHLPGWQKKADAWLEADLAAGMNQAVVEADENFHALPDRFRHKLHHFRYHTLGRAFWFFFGGAFVLQMLVLALDHMAWFDSSRLQALGIPFVSWLSMLALFIIVMYWLVVHMTTREFGKIFEYEFEDTGDAVGDLAETCASIILLIFVLSFLVQAVLALIGPEHVAAFFSQSALLAILAGALIGLIPGTGASLVFTTLYFNLAGTTGAMPFAALAACSIALIGDTQLIGRRQLRLTQRALHLIAFGLAILAGLAIWAIERLLF